MAEGPKFIADAMLGSLARKLRIFGFDTVYFREGPDSDLERIARSEGRVILTSDRALLEHSRRRGLRALCVTGKSERARIERLREEARAAGTELNPGAPRCALCNRVLARVARAEVEADLPSSIARRHRLYFRCTGCDKLYWRGRHWSRLRGLSSLMAGRQ